MCFWFVSVLIKAAVSLGMALALLIKLPLVTRPSEPNLLVKIITISAATATTTPRGAKLVSRFQQRHVPGKREATKWCRS